jgi:hypothetical protein
MTTFIRRAKGFCIAAALAMAAGFCSGQNESEAALVEELLQVPRQFAKVPDCAIAYHTWHEGGTASGMRVTRGMGSTGKSHLKHSYFKQGARWREDIHDSLDKLIRVVSFDGEDYYLYRPQVDYLLVSRDAKPVEIEITQVHSNNPLYCYYMAFFFRSPGTRMPELTSDAAWREQFEEFTIKAVAGAAPGQKRFNLDSSEVEFEVILHASESGQIAIPAFTRLLKEVADPSIQFCDFHSRQLDHWISVPVNGTNATFPTHVTGRARNGEGKWHTACCTTVRYVEKSLRPVPADLPVSAFRVPLHLVPKPVLWKAPAEVTPAASGTAQSSLRK